MALFSFAESWICYQVCWLYQCICSKVPYVCGNYHAIKDFGEGAIIENVLDRLSPSLAKGQPLLTKLYTVIIRFSLINHPNIFILGGIFNINIL